MRIHLYNYARSFIVSFHTDDTAYDAPYEFSNIDEAIAYAEEEIDTRQQALTAHIMDADTGELYVTCYWDDESVPDEDYPEWDDVDESNYDPYLGCDVFETSDIDACGFFSDF